MMSKEYLNINQISDICDIIGCEQDVVNNKSNWCFFPAHKELNPLIHYEYINGCVQFHVECDTPELLDKFEQLLGSKRTQRIHYNKQVKGSSIINAFSDCYKIINPVIEDYVNYLHSKYYVVNSLVESEINKQNAFKQFHYNYLQGFSNDNNGPSENDHTRILMSFLKCPNTPNLPFGMLESFFNQLNIKVDCKKDGIKIYINKGYKNGRDIIDGLIVKDNDFAVILENKVCGAPDQPEQIKRYVEALNNIPFSNIYVIYLTKDGSVNDGRPSKDSCPENLEQCLGSNLICVNYHDDILPWLRDIVLPQVKYTSVGWAVNNYVDYLEMWFGEDVITKSIVNNLKNAIFTALSINDRSCDEHCKTKKLYEIIKELQTSTKYDALKEILVRYVELMISPLREEFKRETIKFFKDNGKNVIVNDRLNTGYIQVRSEDWDSHVHYEWCELTPIKLFFDKEPLKLMVHIEGKGLKGDKANFNQNHKEMPISFNLNDDCLADKIRNNTTGEWLKNVYGQFICFWDELEAISNKLTQNVSL
jgi:ssDNA-specific exonuclease RecJ